MPSENDRQAQDRQTRANRTRANQPQGRRVQARRVPATAAQAEQVQARWRARALRYVLIYLLMGSALVTLRYQTREVYPQLSALRDTRTELQRQQRELSLKVQSLTGEQRVRDWALAHGMMPYAQATKQTQAFGPPVAPPDPAPATTQTQSTQTQSTQTQSAQTQSPQTQSSQTQSPTQPGSTASQPPVPNPLTVRTVWK